MPEAASNAMMIALLAGSLLSTRLYSSVIRPKLILKIMLPMSYSFCELRVLLFVQNAFEVSQPYIARRLTRYRTGNAIVFHGNMQTCQLTVGIIWEFLAAMQTPATRLTLNGVM